jgi:hypothetical protein
MMRIWNKTRYGSEEGERLNLDVCGRGDNLGFVEGDVGVVLFVDVEVFDEAFVKERIERHLLFS